MRPRPAPFALALTAAVALQLAAADPGAPARDWPQFRGPLRDGCALDELLRAWPTGGPKVAWKIPLGPAFSQIAVAGDVAYTGFSDAENEYVGAFDARTGAERWRQALGQTFVLEEFGSGPRGTPTVAGGVVYALGGRGVLRALRAENGAVLWTVDLTTALGATVPRFGYAGSPLVVDDLLVLEVGGSDKRQIVAFDRSGGTVRWAGFEGPASYSSPVIGTLAGSRQIVHASGKTVRGIALDGHELWSYTLEEASIASPVLVPGDRVFVSASGDSGCAMLRVRKTESGQAAEVLWKNRDMRNHYNSTVYADGFLYGFDNATLKCLSAETGEVRWAKRGLGKGSLAVAGDRLVILGDLGLMILAERTPEAYREIGSFQVLDESRAWTAPSIAGGRAYVRNLVGAACIDLKGGTP